MSSVSASSSGRTRRNCAWIGGSAENCELESQNAELEVQTAELEDSQGELTAANDELVAQQSELERALGELGEERRRVGTFYSFAEQLARTTEPQQLLETALAVVADFAAAEAGVVYAFDEVQRTAR